MPVAEKKNTNTSYKNDDNNLTFLSFVEIFMACLKVAVFIACIFFLKEIFSLVNELFLCVSDTSFDILKVQIVPAAVLLVLAGFAFWIMSKD